MKLLVFTAVWCRPCQSMKPYLSALDGIVEYEIIDADETPELMTQYNVRGVPTLIMLKDHKEVARQVGAVSQTRLLEWVKDAQTINK